MWVALLWQQLRLRQGDGGSQLPEMPNLLRKAVRWKVVQKGWTMNQLEGMLVSALSQHFAKSPVCVVSCKKTLAQVFCVLHGGWLDLCHFGSNIHHLRFYQFENPHPPTHMRWKVVQKGWTMNQLEGMLVSAVSQHFAKSPVCGLGGGQSCVSIFQKRCFTDVKMYCYIFTLPPP